MIIDSSAVLAIYRNEPERDLFALAIEAADSRRMPVATFVETSTVLTVRFGPEVLQDLDLLINRASIELVPVNV